jgi:hypothetical protein
MGKGSQPSNQPQYGNGMGQNMGGYGGYGGNMGGYGGNMGGFGNMGNMFGGGQFGGGFGNTGIPGYGTPPSGKGGNIGSSLTQRMPEKRELPSLMQQYAGLNQGVREFEPLGIRGYTPPSYQQSSFDPFSRESYFKQPTPTPYQPPVDPYVPPPVDPYQPPMPPSFNPYNEFGGYNPPSYGGYREPDARMFQNGNMGGYSGIGKYGIPGIDGDYNRGGYGSRRGRGAGGSDRRFRNRQNDAIIGQGFPKGYSGGVGLGRPPMQYINEGPPPRPPMPQDYGMNNMPPIRPAVMPSSPRDFLVEDTPPSLMQPPMPQDYGMNNTPTPRPPMQYINEGPPPPPPMQYEMGPRENDFGPIQGLTADASLYQPQLPFASSISAPQQQQFQQGMPARYGQRVPPRYGRGRGFAEGGLASVQEAGMVTDGGMKLEEEVLAAVLGQHPNPDEVFKQYIDAYGEEGLMELLAMIEQMMPAEGRMVEGAGDGLNDAIPAMIEGQEPAALSKDEYVIPADVVSHAGNGSSQAGGQKFDQLVSQVRKNKTGNDMQPQPMELEEVVKEVV